MEKAVKVNLPVDKPEDTLKLCGKIIEKDTADALNSSLTGVIDMTAFGNQVTSAKAKRTEADVKEASAQKKYEQAANKCGLGKGQHKDVKDTIAWYARQIKDLLLVIHDGNEEALTEYGFNVVITTTGARKNIKIELPIKPEDMVELGKDIKAQHALLLGGSPLTAALVNMTVFGTLVTDTETLLHDWDELRAQVESLHNQALVIIGYDAGQTSTTIGTLYHEIGKIRVRLLQKFQGEEKALEEFGFDVVTTEFRPGRKKGASGFSITGTITDSETGLPIVGALVLLVEPDIFITTNAEGKYFVPVQPAATYTMIVHKGGYQDQAIPGVVVTAGAVTTRNILLVTGAVAGNTGTVAGTVTQGGAGANATISIEGTTLFTTTSPTGQYTRDGVAEGPQSVKCVLNSNPAIFQTQAVTVTAGGTVTVNFNFL